jgi:hypothetical protein
MTGGKQHVYEAHELETTNEWGHKSKTRWRCTACGQLYFAATKAPSCTVDFIHQVYDSLAAYDMQNLPEASLKNALNFDKYLKSKFHWPKFFRERIMRDWCIWRAYAAEISSTSPDGLLVGWTWP